MLMLTVMLAKMPGRILLCEALRYRERVFEGQVTLGLQLNSDGQGCASGVPSEANSRELCTSR